MRYGMAIDLKRCIGCNACTIACKQENGTPEGIFFTKTLANEVGKYPYVKRTYTPVLCNHCSDAPCLKVCPTGATHKRNDGIIMVDQDKCVGCRACYVACPYKNRYYMPISLLKKGYYGGLNPFEEKKHENMQGEVAVKCSFCFQRVDEGLEPACVVTCIAGARIFGNLDNPASEVSKLIRLRNGRQPLAERNTDPSVYYLE